MSRRRYVRRAWCGMPHIGMRRPFATGRLVRVSWSSRATRWASSKKASKKSPRRNSRIARGCWSLSARYWRIIGVSSDITDHTCVRHLPGGLLCSSRAAGAVPSPVVSYDPVMDSPDPRRLRRRRGRRRAAPPGQAGPAAAAAPIADAPASLPGGAAGPAPAPPRVAAPERGVAPPGATGAGEQVWERTHLERTMFQLAREHAEAAARCARGRPPDRAGEQTHSLVAVLMSYFALEAFINMVGSDRLGDRFRHYDRMSPEGKWAEVTRLASKTGQTFAEEGPELRALSTLRSWRNVLTHYKGAYEDVQQGRSGETRIAALLCADNAARAVEIARTLYRAFYALDRRSPPRQFIWLDDRPHDPHRQRPQSAPAAGAAQEGADAPGSTARGRPRRGRRRRR